MRRRQLPTYRLRRAIVAGCLAVGWLVATASPAAAHAEFIDASPAPGTGLAQAPAQVVIRFSEPLNLSLSSIDVVDERGADAGDGRTLPVEGDRQAMRRRLGLLEPGRYTVRWTSVSPLDGHTLRGSYAFGVGTSTPGDETIRSNPLDSEGPLGMAGRAMLLGGLVLWAGAAWLGGAAARASVPTAALRGLRRGGTMGTALGATAVAVSSTLVATGSLGNVADVLTASQAGRFRLAVLVLAATAALFPARWLWPDRVLSVGAVIAEAASGHAASAPAPAAATAVFAVHLGAVAVWVFAIAASLLAGRRLLAALGALFPYAAGAAAGVAATGVAAAAFELTTSRDLLDTGYGRAVALKASLLVTMVALGTAHHRRRTRQRQALRPVRRRVVAELGTAALAVAVATLLVAFPNPPREVEAAERLGEATRPLAHLEGEPAVSVAAANGPFIVGVTVSPPEPGRVRIRLDVVGVEPGDGLRQATVRAAAAGHEVVEVALGRCGHGCFEAPADLAQGTWELTASVVSNRGPIRASVAIPLPAADGARELARALGALESLRSARMLEQLRGAEAGPPLVTRYQFRAPDAMRFDIDGGGSSVRLGDARYRRDGPAAAWVAGSSPSPFEWPGNYYRQFWTPSAAVRFLGEETIDGVRSRIVGFVRADVSAWFRVWVGVDDGLVRRLEMRAEGHLMDQTTRGFAEPVEIDVPHGP